jgi:hypothetical protein
MRLSALIQQHDAGNLSAAARRTGISYPVLHALVAGKNPNPKLETVVKLAKSYRVSLDWLVGLDAPEERDPVEVARDLLARAASLLGERH